MTEFKKTITSIFLVPTLQLPKDVLVNNGFINGFIKDSTKDYTYPDSIYVLFKPKNLDRFREFLDDEYERTKNIIEDYDNEDGFVTIVYKLDATFKEDYVLIREGKYSKTSEEFQKLFPRVVKIVVNGIHRDELSLQYRVFKKTKDLVDFWEEKLGMKFSENQEVWTGFSIENETLDINKIKQTIEEHVK